MKEPTMKPRRPLTPQRKTNRRLRALNYLQNDKPRRTRPRIFGAISSKNGIHPACLNTIPFHLFDQWMVNYYPGVDSSRNMLMDYFLNESGCDYLMWIDDDILLPPNVSDLWNYAWYNDLPLIAPMCSIMWNRIPYPGFYYWRDTDLLRTWTVEEVEYYRNEAKKKNIPPVVTNVDMVGGGCNLIRRDVAIMCRDEWDESFRYTWVDDADRVRRGEDTYFMRMVRDEGYTWAAHLGVEVGHIKPINIDWVSNMFYNQKTMLKGIDDKVKKEPENPKE